MGMEWRNNPPARHRRRRSPKFGAYTEMTIVIGLIGFATDKPIAAAIEDVAKRYPWLPTDEVTSFVIRVRGYYARGEAAIAERMVHNFILKAQREMPEPPEEPADHVPLVGAILAFVLIIALVTAVVIFA